MEQVLAVKELVQDVALDEAKAKVGAEWADHLLQGRAVTVCVPNVERRSLTPPGSLAISKYVLSVVQE